MLSLRTTLAPGALAAAVGLAAVALTARSRGIEAGLPLDDAWIHAAFARHLAAGEGWSLFRGGAPGGETSLLWPLLLAPAERWGEAAPALARVLGAVAWLLVPGLAGVLATTPARAVGLAIAVGLCGPLLFASLSGMETVPVLAVGLGAIYLFARGRSRAAMVLAGAAVWLRPDAVLLLATLAVGHVIRRRMDAEDLGPAWTGSLAPIVPGAILALAGVVGLAWAEGSFPPATLGGRRWISGLDPGLDWGHLGQGGLALGRDWIRALDAELGLSRATAAWPTAVSGFLRWAWRLAAGLGVGIAVVTGLRSSFRSWRGRSGVGEPGPVPLEVLGTTARSMIVAWAVAVLLFYVLVLPDRGHVGRYQPLVYVLFALGILEGTSSLRARGGVFRQGGASVLALLLVAGWGWGVVQAATSWAGCVDHLNHVHRRAARELSTRTGPGGIVAVFDVGVAAYAHQGPMVDMSGLSDPVAASALQERSMADLLQARGVTHVLLPVFEEDTAGSLRDRLGLLPRDGVDLERTAVYETSRTAWGPAFQYSGHAFRRLFLYRVRHADR